MNTWSYAARRSKLYDRLISLYPASYLSKHREELLQNFEDLERDISSSPLFWAFIISDFIKSVGLEYMHYLKNNRWAQFAAVIVAFLVVLFAWQAATLRIAHSSFDNYAAFRGCARITSETPTSGTCTLAGGQTITMVQYRGKWYLQGDLPRCVGNLCF